MNVAPDRACEHTPLAEQHEVRERVAQGALSGAQKTPGLRDAKLLDGELGNLCGIANTRRADLDYFLRDDVGNRVVAINQAKRVQGPSVGRVQTLDFFGS